MFTSGSAASGQLQIGIALVLQDRFSNQAREASSQIRRLHNEAKAATNANLAAARNFAGQGAAIGAGISAGLWGAVKVGASFIDVMTQVGAIAKDDGVSIKSLFDQAQSLGQKTMFDSRDIASGMQYFAMAGMTTSNIKNNIEAAANLAAATRHELGGKGGAADLMTNIMKMYQIPNTEMAASHAADLLVTGVTRSNMSLTDLAETIKYAGTTLTNLDASLEQTIALAGVLGNAGLQGSMAGTAMSNAYRYLTISIEKNDAKGMKALNAIGLGKRDFIDASGNLIDMNRAIMVLVKATSGMSNTQRFAKFLDIFGVRGERAATVLSKAGGEYEKILNELQYGSQGRAAEIMAKRMETLAGSIDKVTSAFENVQTTYAAVIEPVLKPVFNGIAWVLEKIRAIMKVPVLGTVVTSLMTIGVVLTTLGLGFMALKATIRLTFNDSLISIRNMFAVLMGGWKGSQISAMQYQATHNAILAQQGAGILGNGRRAAAMAQSATWSAAGAAQLASNRGNWVGNVRQSPGGYYWVRNAQGGVTRTGANRAAHLAGRTMRQAGGINPLPMMGGGMIGASRGMLAVLGRIAGFLTGPVGMGIILLSTVILPPLISAINNNSRWSRENTDAIKDAASIEREKLMAERSKNKGLTNEEVLVLMIKSLQDLTASLKSNKPEYTVVVNMDGKEVIKKVVKDTITEEVINSAGK